MGARTRHGLLLLLCFAAVAIACAPACGSDPIPPDRQPWQDEGTLGDESAGGSESGTETEAPSASDEGPAEATADVHPGARGADTQGPLAQYEGREPLDTLRGRASYYHDSLAGNHTANGDIYDPAAFTAASRELPFGTVLRVVRVDGGQSVLVRVNDRGPFGNRRRILDLSRAAAESIDMIRAGVVDVRVEVLHRPE